MKKKRQHKIRNQEKIFNAPSPKNQYFWPWKLHLVPQPPANVLVKITQDNCCVTWPMKSWIPTEKFYNIATSWPAHNKELSGKNPMPKN